MTTKKDGQTADDGGHVKPRVGAVVAFPVWDGLDRLNAYYHTTNSSTMAAVLEQWMIDQGMLNDSDRQHSHEFYTGLCLAARSLGKI